jgi:hypothetical protein
MAVSSVAAGRSATELSGENRENKTREKLLLERVPIVCFE